MAICFKMKEELENSLIRTIRIVCQKHIKNSQAVESVEGLFGVTVEGGHTFLFNVKEIKLTDSSENSQDQNLAISNHENDIDLSNLRSSDSVPSSSVPSNKAPSRDNSPTKEPTVTSASAIAGRDSEVQNRENVKTLPVEALPLPHNNSDARDCLEPSAERPATPKRPADRQGGPVDGDQNMDDIVMESPDKRRKLHRDSPLKQRVVAGPLSQTDPGSLTADSAPQVESSPQVHTGEAGVNAPPPGEYQKVLVVGPTGHITCTLCNQIFSNKNSGRRHVNFKHFRLGESCPYCQRLFRCQDELNDHLVGEHSGARGGYVCAECNKDFKSKHTLKDHILKAHRGFHRFRCYLCGQGFQSSKACRHHLATKHPQCQECGMSLMTLEGHVCNTDTPPGLPALGRPAAAGSATAAIPVDPRGSAALGRFRMNKKALGDLAKSIAEQVVGGEGGVDDGDGGGPDHDGVKQHSEARNEGEEGVKYIDRDSGDKIKKEEQRSYKPRILGTSIQKWEHTHEYQENQMEEVEDKEGQDMYLSGIQTPSPASSDMSDSDDCSLMDLCHICEQEFRTQHEYQVHMREAHPWCRWCTSHMKDPATHSTRCRGRPGLGLSLHQAQRREEEALKEIISIDD